MVALTVGILANTAFAVDPTGICSANTKGASLFGAKITQIECAAAVSMLHSTTNPNSLCVIQNYLYAGNTFNVVWGPSSTPVGSFACPLKPMTAGLYQLKSGNPPAAYMVAGFHPGGIGTIISVDASGNGCEVQNIAQFNTLRGLPANSTTGGYGVGASGLHWVDVFPAPGTSVTFTGLCK